MTICQLLGLAETFGRGIVKTGLPLHERLVVELSPHEPGKVFIRNGAVQKVDFSWFDFRRDR